MIEQPQRETLCPRCAATVPPTERACPKCGLAIQPGVAYFDSASPDRPAETETVAGGAPKQERKVITCLPMDIDRVTRAEAVDGWALTDTTVDPDISGNIRAHFRRPLRPERPAGSVQAGAGRPAEKAKKPAPEKESSRRPDFGPEPSPSPQLRTFLMFALVLGTIVFLADTFGIVGLVLGLIFVPGLLRKLLDDGKRRGKH